MYDPFSFLLYMFFWFNLLFPRYCCFIYLPYTFLILFIYFEYSYSLNLLIVFFFFSRTLFFLLLINNRINCCLIRYNLKINNSSSTSISSESSTFIEVIYVFILLSILFIYRNYVLKMIAIISKIITILSFKFPRSLLNVQMLLQLRTFSCRPILKCHWK